MFMANSQGFSCPDCGQVDMVQKVSALVEGGTVAGIYSSTAGSHISGITLSTKASQLAPPSKPTYKGPWGFFSVVFVGLGIFWGGIFLIAMLAVLVTDRYGDAIHRLVAIATYGIFAAFCLGITFLIFRWKRNTALARQSRYKDANSQWVRSMDKWNQLYYCARNDVVFLPNKAGACVPASQMLRLL